MVNNNGDLVANIIASPILGSSVTTNNLTYKTSKFIGYTDKSFADLSAGEFLESFKNSELPKLWEMVEDAKLMYEEEGDDDSFAEYQGLKQAYDWLKKSLRESPARMYNIPSEVSYNKGGPIQQVFGSPYGHTGFR